MTEPQHSGLSDEQVGDLLRQQRAQPSAEMQRRFENELPERLNEVPPVFVWWKRPWVAAVASLAVVLVSLPLVIPKENTITTTQTTRSTQEAPMNLGAAAPAAHDDSPKTEHKKEAPIAQRQKNTSAVPAQVASSDPKITAPMEAVIKEVGGQIKVLGKEHYEVRLKSDAYKLLRRRLRETFPGYYDVNRVSDNDKEAVAEIKVR